MKTKDPAVRSSHGSLSVRFIIVFVLCFIHSHCFAIDGYKRIVSLAPSLTQSLYYMDSQSLLIGCTSYCNPEKTDRIEVVASAVKPNLEKIASLKPDLVITAGLTSEKDIATLRKLGIKVELFLSPKSFDEICVQFERLGQLIGKEQKAKEIVDNSRSKVRALQSEILNKNPKPKLFIQIGDAPLFGVIPNTFMNDYISYSGGVNVLADLNKGTVGRELIVARNPDYIFVVTMGIAAEKEKNSWAQFSFLQAVRNKHIYVIPSDMACRPTPVTFVQTLELIIKYMQQQ